ncbi:MAG: hypothetical protein KKA79_10775 [Nanoarchaeota archaeon]|nr:hypothetical protein [Nanoarchaeota archaeon]MCG2717421.1 hypothetical protein [Nanoarchaeota archaeon]
MKLPKGFRRENKKKIEQLVKEAKIITKDKELSYELLKDMVKELIINKGEMTECHEGRGEYNYQLLMDDLSFTYYQHIDESNGTVLHYHCTVGYFGKKVFETWNGITQTYNPGDWEGIIEKKFMKLPQ